MKDTIKELEKEVKRFEEHVEHCIYKSNCPNIQDLRILKAKLQTLKEVMKIIDKYLYDEDCEYEQWNVEELYGGIKDAIYGGQE